MTRRISNKQACNPGFIAGLAGVGRVAVRLKSKRNQTVRNLFSR